MKQFQLDIDKYFDNNNFVEWDQINLKDNRFFFLESGSDFDAMNVKNNPIFVSNKIVSHINLFDLDKKVFFNVTRHELFGSFYFYSNIKIESSRTVMTFPILLSEFGGLYYFLVIFFQLLATRINHIKWTAKRIRSVFRQRLDLNTSTKVKLEYKSLRTLVKTQSIVDQREYFKKAKVTLGRVFDIFRILNLVNKLQSAVSILVSMHP